VRAEGGTRVRGLRALKRAWKLIETYKTPYVVSTGARSHLDLRAPRELAAIGDVVGVPADRIRDGLAEWGRLAERNRHRQSDAFIEPGVWRPSEDDQS
jgi:ribonuclease P protein subunit Rpp30 (EC 3.1.26.5)